MKGLLSLDQELRAAHRAKGQKSAPKSNRPFDLKETERPWQPDIDQVHQTMRELLRAVAGLSGVELPGLPPGLLDNEANPPRLDIRSLKDRICNDLEGFSIKTTEDLTKRAREQAHAALDGIQNEVGDSIEQVAAEFRENLHLPAQIEKLLVPCVEDAEARLERLIAQKFEHLVAQHEQLVQEKLQGTLSSVHAQISALEQTVQQVRQLQSEAAAQPSAEQPNAVEQFEHLLAENERSVQHRLQATIGPLQAQINTLEQTVQQVRELKADEVAQPSAEQPNAAEVAGRIDQLAAEFRERLQDPAQIEKLLEPRVGEAAARLEKSICQKVEHLVARHEQLVQEKLQGTLTSVQAQIGALEQTARQTGDLKAEPVAKLPAEVPLAVVDIAMKEGESSLNKGLNGFLDQAFTRIELSFNNFPDTVGLQPAPGTGARIIEPREAIPFSDMDREALIQQALDHLGQLGSKDPYPVS
jgi:hypothetical protein